MRRLIQVLMATYMSIAVSAQAENHIQSLAANVKSNYQMCVPDGDSRVLVKMAGRFTLRLHDRKPDALGPEDQLEFSIYSTAGFLHCGYDGLGKRLFAYSSEIGMEKMECDGFAERLYNQ